MSEEKLSRRELLRGAAAMAGVAVVAQVQDKVALPAPVVPLDASLVQGAPTSALSERSPFVTEARTGTGVVTGASFSPIQDFSGSIFPTDLHFERHHNGVAQIDPSKYTLLVQNTHGAKSVVLTLDDIKRFPSVSRAYFLECAGNGRSCYRAPKREMTAQVIDGMLGSAEWTGVPVRALFAELGIHVAPNAHWVLAEGGDASRLSRSIPLEKMLDDALLVYAQNGEPLRPPAGFPVRLLVPGWEGNANIKWLRRLKVIAEPNMSKDETSKYTDPLPNDTARQFSFELDVKSIITRPSFPMKAVRGWQQVEGIAWTGRGKVARVDVSTDGGRTWTMAELQDPIQSKAITRFRLMWNWDGRATTLLSRALDETGAVQPTLAEFKATRGPGTDYHFNHIRSWAVESDGSVFYAVPA